MTNLRAVLTGALLAALVGCGSDDPPGQTFYEREIEPILVGSCAGNTGGCHAVDPDDEFAFAAGNFDVTSFENVQKRRDVLRPYGAYGTPLLLIKAVGATGELGVTYDGEFRPLEVQHSGGGIFAVGSDSYLTLLEWADNGATETGLPPVSEPAEGEGDCSTFVPDEFDEGTATGDSTYGQFVSDVAPVLQACASSSCHGAPQSDFYITCGENDRQMAFNFSQAHAFVDDPPGNSQLLQVPLAVGGTGSVHTGGAHFDSSDDDDYVAIEGWAGAVGKVDFAGGDAGKQFFADNVQPLLLTRGCSFQACHSPSSTNDFQLRSGSQGFFSSIALERNYERLRNNFMALEVPDARRGRAAAKTILASFGGIAHRGGPVLETPGSGGSDPVNCDATYDPATASAFCTVQEWVNIERAALIGDGLVLPLGPADSVPLVYVARQPGHTATPLEFDEYQPNSDLRVTSLSFAADGSPDLPVAAGTSILGGCPGAGTLSQVDVRGPDVRFDGNTVAFAMRTAAGEPLQIYTVELDSGTCTQVTDNEGSVDGILIHNFDPAWSPDGNWIVYASTRGSEGGSPAPTRSRKLFLPQSDIWRIKPDGSGAERMTFLTNSEVSPQFMREGRVIMTTEKVSDGFYQLSGRRMNWDRTDYHPLLAQRSQSPFAEPDDPEATLPSINYQQATELREGFDGSFILVLSDPGARGGAGTLGIFNRSVGTFEAGRRDPGFLASVVTPDRNATGRVGESTEGAYRSPFSLPDGRIMASYAAFNGDLGNANSLAFDLVAVNPAGGGRETVLAGGGEALVEAVLALKYPQRELFLNRRQLVFGGSVDSSLAGDGQAVMHFPDAPLIFTLLNANLRRGRPVDLFRGADQLAIYEEHTASSGTTSGNMGDIYQDRELLGTADLADDGSVRVRVPAGRGIILELQDGSGNPLVTMREEHQLGPGENITFGIVEPLFDAVCGGCHGTVSGREIDVFVTPDALTGASQSLSVNSTPDDL